MSFAVLRHPRIRVFMAMASLGVLMLSAPVSFAQSNTAVGSGGATPVMLGNNARPDSTSGDSTGSGVQPLVLVHPQSSGDSSGSPGLFEQLMDQTNTNMSDNGNAAAAARQKILAAQAEARERAYDQQNETGSPKGASKKASDDTGPLIMHYAEPNDTSAPPPHTFNIQ